MAHVDQNRMIWTEWDMANGRHPKNDTQRAQAVMRRPVPTPGAYAVVFVEDDGSPASVVATFPGPTSAEMYGRLTGGPFRVVQVCPSRQTP